MATTCVHPLAVCAASPLFSQNISIRSPGCTPVGIAGEIAAVPDRIAPVAR